MAERDLWKALADKELTESEHERLADLLATDEGCKRLLSMMDERLVAIEGESVSRHTSEAVEEMYAYIRRRIAMRRYRQMALRVCAVLLPIATFIGGWMLSTHDFTKASDDEWIETATACGERKEVVFQDGTHVWLGAESRLRYPACFSSRQRELQTEGEAYFSVAADKERPLLVHIAHATVKVTGTEFNVCAWAHDSLTVVTLDKGTISVMLQNGEVRMREGECLTYNSNTHLYACAPTPLRRTLWRQGVIAFDKAPLTEVIALLRRWYGVEFELGTAAADSSLSNHTFTLTSTRQPLDSLLADLQLLAPLKFRRHDGKIRISMK